jgi:hypothetical protein
MKIAASDDHDEGSDSSPPYASEDEDYEYTYDDFDTECSPVAIRSASDFLMEESSRLQRLGGSVCTQCRQESHLPAKNCQRVQEWIARRHQLETFPPSFVDVLAKYFIQDMSTRFDFPSLEEAGIDCRRFNWSVNAIGQNAGIRTGTDYGAIDVRRKVRREVFVVNDDGRFSRSFGNNGNSSRRIFFGGLLIAIIATK